MLEATARNALGDPAAAGRALERALDLAEPDSTLSAFLIHPVPALLERYARYSTRHAALISEILDLLPQDQRGPAQGAQGGLGNPGGPGGAGSPPGSEGSWGVVPPANRAAQPGRDPRSAVYADQLVHAGDRPRAVPVSAHGPDARTSPLCQARRARSHRGGRASPRPRPARFIRPHDLRFPVACLARRVREGVRRTRDVLFGR